MRGSSPGPARDAARPVRFRWCFAQVPPDLDQTIRRIPWNTLASWPAATRVKVAENRDVWRIDLGGRTIYAKCYRSQGLVKTVVESVRGLAARREWLALRQAAAIGVLAPEALAYASTTMPSPSQPYSALLITAALPAESLSLEQAWLAAEGLADPRLARQRKRRLIEAMAELLARAHAGGLFHRDLHIGNILIFPHNGTMTTAMIDLHNARLCRGIAASGVRNNLVHLNQWFARHASRSERMRFLKAYCRQLRQRLPGGTAVAYEPKTLAQGVLKASVPYAARLYTKRDRRILKRNKYFGRLDLSNGWSASVVLDIKHGRPYDHSLDALPDKKQWRQILSDPPALLAAGAGPHKNAHISRIVQARLPFGGATWPIIVKHNCADSPLRWLTRLLGQDSLRREFVAGWRCLHRDLPVALPLAILERGGVLRQESILLLEHVNDSHDLATFVQLHLPEMPGEQARLAKRRIGDALARTLRRMWTCGLVHRDLKAASIRLQVRRGDLDGLRIVLGDVGGISRPWRLRKALLRSLARLDAELRGCPGGDPDGSAAGAAGGAPGGGRGAGRLAQRLAADPEDERAGSGYIRRAPAMAAAARPRGRCRMSRLAAPVGILTPFRLSAQFWSDLAGRDFRRILIIKPSAVGDIVRTLPVLTALRRRWPEAHIAWLVAGHCADVLAGHPALDQVIYFDRRAYAAVGRDLSITRAFTTFLKDLRGARFDLVIDLQGLFRSGFFSLASGAPVRIGRGDSRECTGLFYTHRAAVDARRMHAIALNAAMVAPLGVKVEPAISDLHISPGARTGAERVLRENGLVDGAPYAAIAPGTNWETKTWPAGKFGHVAAGLRQRFGLQSVVVGTAGQRAMAGEIRRHESTVIDLCGKSSLAELVAMIAGARIVVANDSGPLHIADALDLPLVGVFGPTRPEIVGPFRRTGGVIRVALPCLGCGIKRLAKCPHGHQCMNGLAAEDVLDLAGRQVERTGEPARTV